MLLTDGGNYLKAALAKNGDVITFTSEGGMVKSKYTYPQLTQQGAPHPRAGEKRDEFVIDCNMNGQSYQFRLNRTNQMMMIDAFGRDTEKWVGKKASIEIVTQLVGGKPTASILVKPIKSVDIKAQHKAQMAKEMQGPADPENIIWEE